MKLVKINPPLSDNIPPAPMTTIVMHATAGATARSSVDHLRARGLAYHFIIARDGKDSAKSVNADGTPAAVYQLADTGHWVSHVGSHVPLPGGYRANRIGIGISLANLQNGEDYAPAQIAALDEVIRLVLEQQPTVKHMTSHARIQPWNRRDPVALDVKALAARHGLAWFEPTAAEIAKYTPPKTKKP